MDETNSADLLLNEAFEKFVKNVTRHYVLIDGTVDAYNEENNTCDILIQGTLWTNVPIAVLTGVQASFYPIPVIGTNCTVTWRDGHKSLPQIVQFDQIDQLLINCQTIVSFNGGKNGGLPLSPNLVTRLNLIEAQQNAILDILKEIVIPSTPYDFAPLFAAINDLTETQQDDIQSQVITQ